MQHRNTLKKLFTENKRQAIVLLSALFLASAALLAGIFSYFHSKDAVTNRMSALNGDVAVREPEWLSKGQYMARASEPGMKIPKDPRGVNTGQTDLYIRLKMTLSLDEYSGDLSSITAEEAANGEVGIPTSGKRLQAIIDAIMRNNAGDKFLNLTIASGDEDNASEWQANSLNTNFVADQKNYGTDEKLIYYFYYKSDSSGADPLMTAVPPGESTAVLFNEIDIPIYKKDYLGVFDQGYTITIEAEGIPSSAYPEGLEVSQAPAAFNDQ